MRLLTTLLKAVVLMAPWIVWAISERDLSVYLSSQVPPGQVYYVLSKLFGLVAISLVWWQCMAALSRNNPLSLGFEPLKRRAHIALGVSLAAMCVLHAGFFITAVSIRAGHFAGGLLLPHFFSGYYKFYVTLGLIALWCVFAVMWAGKMRKNNPKFYGYMHKLALAVFALGFLHGISVGTETRFGAMTYVYALMAISFFIALVGKGLNSLVLPAGQNKQQI